jgi:RNA polymerase sigma factor (sigma-70 family)
MTGNAADADDLVQETFVRALEKPPRRRDEPLRPWLVRVAMNLSRDLLRRRRRVGYKGEWLPSPVPTASPDSPASYEPPARDEDSPAARYEMLESISFAFLLALEALTPTMRAVLLLRDVFDYSTGETAGALAISEANVKVTLHRARRLMRGYDKDRGEMSAARSEATSRALEQFLLLLDKRDADGLERLLARDVVSVADGGGEVAAALKPVRGRDRVVRLMLGLRRKYRGGFKTVFLMLNGMPALLIEFGVRRPGTATRFTMQFEVNGSGQIRRINTVLAPAKLVAV